MDYGEILKSVDALYPISYLFDRRNIRANVKCPFHNDTKASAHIYGDGLYCFTCGKTFRASSIARQLGMNVKDLFEELVDLYGGEDKVLEEANARGSGLEEFEVVMKPKFKNQDIGKFVEDFFENG